jgi:hypothetical protein
MDGLFSVSPRLAKLLPLLASNQSGEVVATAAAITRTLTKAGADWHVLAALVRGDTEPQAAPGFTFVELTPKTAQQLIEQMAWRPGVTADDRLRLERCRKWLLKKPRHVRLPAKEAAWLDELWRQAFRAGT